MWPRQCARRPCACASNDMYFGWVRSLALANARIVGDLCLGIDAVCVVNCKQVPAIYTVNPPSNPGALLQPLLQAVPYQIDRRNFRPHQNQE